MDIKKIKRAKGFLFDLDGVFIQSDKLLPGALETIKVLENKSIPFRFLTNTTTKSRNTLHMMLLNMGIKCEKEHIFSAGYSGIQTIREMGNPSCRLYISDDLKKDYKIFKEELERWGNETKQFNIGTVALCKSNNGFGLAVYYEEGWINCGESGVRWSPLDGLEVVESYFPQKSNYVKQ